MIGVPRDGGTECRYSDSIIRQAGLVEQQLLRITINLGDVIINGQDTYGDGVLRGKADRWNPELVKRPLRDVLVIAQ
jgi:hypothetical protein